MSGRSRSRRTARIFILALLGALCAGNAFGDGGRLRFRQAAGPFMVTLFTAPDPLTRGRADFSVAVESEAAPGLVRDADIKIILTPGNGRGGSLVLHADHAEATSKWLQAANFSFPSGGAWKVRVVVRRGREVGECSDEVQVEPGGTPNLAWDILAVPLAALFLVMHEQRKRSYARERSNRLS